MEQVLKVDKDSPDRSLFDRFKAKLNSGDDISLRISSESRGLGKGELHVHGCLGRLMCCGFSVNAALSEVKLEGHVLLFIMVIIPFSLVM